MIRFNFTKPKLLASAQSLDQRKKSILTQNIHTFMKVCKWFLVWMHIKNAPNSFELSSVLQSDIKKAEGANCGLWNLTAFTTALHNATTMIWLTRHWIYTRAAWRAQSFLEANTKHVQVRRRVISAQVWKHWTLCQHICASCLDIEINYLELTDKASTAFRSCLLYNILLQLLYKLNMFQSSIYFEIFTSISQKAHIWVQVVLYVFQ